jgi:serine/threonine protein kinase
LNKIEILFWSKQIINGLDFLHGNKIVHRDLRPSNIFFDGKSLVLGELGLAKSMEELRRSRTFLCTLIYASPEVLNSEDLDGFQADIW